MNAKQMLPLVQAAQLDAQNRGEDVNLYDFAARVAAEQKEIDARLAEAVGESEVATIIRSAV